MSSYFFNFTTFDIQLWPPPPKIDPKVFADYALNPSFLVPVLLIYHTFTSVVLQAQNFRDYPGRRDTVWYQVCFGHLMVQPTQTTTLENLSRLASKPGVQSTLILSKSDGSIIRSTGLLAAKPSSSSQDLAVGNGTSHNGPGAPVDAIRSGIEYPGSTEDDRKGNSAEDIARMVFAFVVGANAFTEGMDKSDEVKLLRLRTRKSEIVIVPDSKFLLVVIHDTPPA